MDARHLGYFLAIVDHGGFGRAAAHLHIAQPSLSQAIAGLERELGVDLFHRVGRGAVLTDTGARIVEPARQVLRDLETVRATARSARGLRRGRVALVTMPSPGIEPLTTLMARFARAHPLMTVSAESAFTPEEVVQAVRTGAAEIGLLGAAEHPRLADLRVLPVADQPLVLLSPPEGDDDPPPGPVDRAGLDGLRLVVSQPGSLMRRLVDDILAGGADAHIAAEVGHRTSILPLVLAGVGHAVVPESWRPTAERLGARVRRIEPVSLLRVMVVCRAARLTPAAQAFLETVEGYVADTADAADAAEAAGHGSADTADTDAADGSGAANS
ncbi:LysR family transcriptional regulator [Streptomonospora sp. S1-112]|uniref:LysR family transcriptional regulator n=1 Tax=Streptomonospora mangrovi TaxID=2883123 RepID=A0A9X3NKQ6_9ACTN|nr:LysR family transcriptional regulator [Streptomonospora mangrovi]MDA0563898.1 LysR family transcriptional regulator [Streptomonospora mangrovi]